MYGLTVDYNRSKPEEKDVDDLEGAGRVHGGPGGASSPQEENL